MSHLSAKRTSIAVATVTALSVAGFTGAAYASARPATATASSTTASTAASDSTAGRTTAVSAKVPAAQIENILQLPGHMVGNVLNVNLERTDIDNVTLNGVPMKPSFQIDGMLAFQPLRRGKVLFNGDLPFKGTEINNVIDTLTRYGIQVQAEHQHMYDFSPQVWFIHMRATGNPLTIARGLHAAILKTSTPLPQTAPTNPTTPLNAAKLKSILHGFDAEVGSDGVVTVFVARRNTIRIDGIKVNPATNIATNVAFEPLNAKGTDVAVIPDFGMTSKEINPVLRTMRAKGWDIGCLYNQETGESPQLYFSHQYKRGDAYQLAREIRAGLNKTNSR